ncbi:TIGR00701 family protein [Bermanella sp. 47_1433_sub80_T6]|nr:TIGR00701 family protein [Bermanella sp. 47_1433_sub80_T6]
MLWIKAFHLIAIICWFAAIFYLPRLFVYHADSEDKVSRDRFKIMERKLYRGIMTPSMVAVLVLGGWLLCLNPGYYLSAGWMQVKLTLVLLLVGFHFYCGYLLKAFANDKNTKSHKFFRVLNEVPVFMLVAIVILAVVKPF